MLVSFWHESQLLMTYRLPFPINLDEQSVTEICNVKQLDLASPAILGKFLRATQPNPILLKPKYEQQIRGFAGGVFVTSSDCKLTR